ncbi:MAG: 2-octaprenyl-3-methyl-6-methoxy-1,4-benzoquinol hydroxylase [Gammaproteobacteria bacterium]|nr:MAG: 2-octaprenyl-3-methyl-6-methoxy-1,4-benzoquinol hydroxylase [Gammaproteobacteria bacterium]
MTQHADIAVLGGGMVGAALALGAARMGYEVVLIDAAPAPVHRPVARSVQEADPRVSALTRASDYLLRALEVWPAMQPHAVPYRHMHVWEGEAPDQGAIHFDAADVMQPDLGHILENSRVREALWSALSLCPNVDLRANCRVQAMTVADGGVTLTLDEQTLQAGFLVGADGARSWVRQTLNWPMDTRDYPHHALVANVRMEQAHRETAWQRFLPSGPLALLPLGQGDRANWVSIVWSAWPDTVERLMAQSDDTFLASLTEASQGVLGGALEAGPRQAFPLTWRHVRRYASGPVLLVGDAAHTIHPLAGQGVNLGFRDVIAALDVLANARALGLPLHEPRLWATYSRARRKDVTEVAAAMRFFSEVYGAQIPGLMPLRRLGVGLVHRFMPLKREVMCRALGVPESGAQSPAISNTACRSRWAAPSPL